MVQDSGKVVRKSAAGDTVSLNIFPVCMHKRCICCRSKNLISDICFHSIFVSGAREKAVCFAPTEGKKGIGKLRRT